MSLPVSQISGASDASPRAESASASRSPWLGIATLPATLVLFGLASVAIGQDLNGDQYAYHTAWIWTLFNPHQDPSWAAGGPSGLVPSLWNVPWYFLALHAAPNVTVFYLGTLGGMTVWLSGAVAWAALKGAATLRFPLTALATLGSFLSPGVMTEFGTTFGNLPTAGLVLGAVLAYLRRPDGPLGRGRSISVGLLLGLAIGFKLTNAIWLVAVILAIISAEESNARRKIILAFEILAASFAGGLVSGGYWWWRMWDRFENPVFPFYNGVFRSSYGWTDNWHDDRYTVGLIQALTMPVRMATGRLPSEGPGRDIRWAIIAEAALLAVVFWRLRRGRHPTDSASGVTPLVPRSTKTFLFVFVGSGWVVWLLEFGIQRYLIVLELLSILTLISLIDTLRLRSQLRTAAAALLPIALGAMVVVPNWPHVPTGTTWFQLDTAPLARQRNLLVVEPNGALLSHALTAMPNGTIAAEAPTIYNMSGLREPPTYTSKADDEVAHLIASHEGPIVSLTFTSKSSMRVASRAAESYGLQLARADCEPMHSIIGDFAVCPWRRPP